jgi:hypothetical protein
MKKQTDLTPRESAKLLIRRLVPTRARLHVALYDAEARSYRGVPDYSTMIPVYSRSELLALWRLLRDVVESEDWHDDRGSGRGRDLSVPVGG